MHMDKKQPQVFITIQSYLDCAVSPKLRRKWLLRTDLFCLTILKDGENPFNSNILTGLSSLCTFSPSCLNVS